MDIKSMTVGQLETYVEKYGWLLVQKISYHEDSVVRTYLTPAGRVVWMEVFSDGTVSFSGVRRD